MHFLTSCFIISSRVLSLFGELSRFSFPVSRSSFPVPRSSFPVPLSSFSVPRSPFLVLRSSFSVLRSSSVPRSPLPALSLPFRVPRSSIFVARSLFFVGVTSHYWRYNSGQFKQRIPKHHSAVSVLIRKKNIWILRSTLDRKKFQTGSYPAEFTGQLQGILSDIRVQQKKKKD